MREIVQPTVAGMAAEGEKYTGFLYAGLMIAPDGAVRALEFNCRMGDPETQPIMMRLKSDLLTLVQNAVNGTLDRVEVQWDRRVALGVVLAAAGYPDAPRNGDALGALPHDEADVHVFHAGTTDLDGRIVTSGGRVLCVTALGDTVRVAQRRAYDVADRIRFPGCQMRRDIGHRAIGAHPVGDQHVVDGRMRLGLGHGDHDALARRQPVGLDDDRCAFPRDMGMRGDRIVEGLMPGGGDPMPHHELLGEVLGGLEPRRPLRGPDRSCEAHPVVKDFRR